MPTVKGVLGRLRRASLPVNTPRPKPTEPRQPCEPFLEGQYSQLRSQSDTYGALSHTPKQTDIFSLPTELQAQIFLDLSYWDLHAFRAAGKKGYDLLEQGEIIRQWINLNAGRQQFALYPPPENPTFQYLLDQEARRKEAGVLAGEISNYIADEILEFTLRRHDVLPTKSRDEVFHAIKMQLKHKMIPLIITLRHYLEQCAASLIRTTRITGATFRNVFLPQTAEVISAYDVDHMHLVHKFWMFLVWLSGQILRRPTYAGTVERTLRGWSTDERIPHFEFRLFLVFGNVGALTQLIRAHTPKHRRKVIEKFLARLDPERNVQWQLHWQNTGATSGKQVTKEQTDLILNLELSELELWVGSAHKVLVQKGKILKNDQNDHIPVGSAWQVMDFLCDLAGYDVLHLPPPLH